MKLKCKVTVQTANGGGEKKNNYYYLCEKFP